MPKYSIVLLLCYFSLSCTSQFNHKFTQLTNLNANQSLNGTWKLSLDTNTCVDHCTRKVSVPNNWYLDGVDYAGIAKYQTKFDLSEKHREGIHLRRQWLNFEAVDYSAKVYLNNHYLGSHSGYFSPFRFEITDYIADENNTLDVIVDSPNEQQSEDWSLHKTLIKGVLNHHDTRPGGAWSEHGQDNNSGGIWGGVTIESTGDIAIQDVKVTPLVEHVESKLTSGKITLSINSLSTFDGKLIIELGESEKYTKVIKVEKGNQKLAWILPTKKRDLWWPWDWGTPTLHELKISVVNDDYISDVVKEKIGFRKFSFDDENGEFYVNDMLYFIRGTNYIGSQWLASMSYSKYFEDLNLAKKANINSIRVHAHVAGKSFYNLADKLGIIIWQDFPLQWGYSDTAVFEKEAVSQTNDMTDMLFNHASIAFWSGHNEPPWDATWMKYKYKSYAEDQNVGLTEAVYQQLLKAKDNRIVRKASYTKEHPWFGWYSLTYKDYKRKPAASIISEFGAQAFPNLQITQNVLGNENTWPLSQNALSKLKYHNYQPHETLQIAKVEQGKSLSQFITNSQEYQRVVIKYGIEQLRLNKGIGLAGIYQFMFVDSWPSITWSVLDYQRNKKPSFDALSQSYQPLIPIVTRNELSPHLTSVYIINDSRQSYRNLKMKIVDKNSKLSWELLGINAIANQKKLVLKAQHLKGLSDDFDIYLENPKRELIAWNSYTDMDK